MLDATLDCILVGWTSNTPTPTPTTPVNWSCWYADWNSYSSIPNTIPDEALCSSWNPSSISWNWPRSWTCQWINWWSNDSCSANKSLSCSLWVAEIDWVEECVETNTLVRCWNQQCVNFDEPRASPLCLSEGTPQHRIVSWTSCPTWRNYEGTFKFFKKNYDWTKAIQTCDWGYSLNATSSPSCNVLWYSYITQNSEAHANKRIYECENDYAAGDFLISWWCSDEVNASQVESLWRIHQWY